MPLLLLTEVCKLRFSTWCDLFETSIFCLSWLLFFFNDCDLFGTTTFVLLLLFQVNCCFSLMILKSSILLRSRKPIFHTFFLHFCLQTNTRIFRNGLSKYQCFSDCQNSVETLNQHWKDSCKCQAEVDSSTSQQGLAKVIGTLSRSVHSHKSQLLLTCL